VILWFRVEQTCGLRRQPSRCSLITRVCHSIVTLILGIAGSPLEAQEPGFQASLFRADSVRIAEAFRLAQELGDRLWPGLGNTPMPVLLVTDSTEFLVRRAGTHDAVVASPSPRRWAPTLLATFPVDGVPTIVTGTAERTGKSSTDWVLTLIHEHFHQWQYGRPDYYADVSRLNLSGGDTTGMWMLNYPFPYDSAVVGRAVRGWALALRGALVGSPTSLSDLAHVVGARDALRSQLSDADYRYLEFQLWQEGVARFVEYRAADFASRLPEPPPAFRSLPDYRPYRTIAERFQRELLRELEALDLCRDRRVSFYPIGAAIALLLDEVRPGWKQEYSSRPFTLAALIPENRR
jgi:hypothetical protein